MTNRLYAIGELADGTTWQDVPVTVATRVQAEKTGHAQKWALETHSMTMSAFMSWHASKAAGHHSLTWETFLAEAIAADVVNTRSDEADEDEDPEVTPTQTAQSPA